MKKLLLLLALTCSSLLLQAQNGTAEYKGRNGLTISHDKLVQAKKLTEISPDLWHHMQLPYNEHYGIRQLLNMQHTLYFSLVSSKNEDVVFPNSAYEKMVGYIGFEITARSAGKSQTLSATGDEFTAAQLKLLKNLDLGSPVVLKVKYYHLKEGRQQGKIYEGEVSFEPVPFRPAEFPGGDEALTAYLQNNVLDKIKAAEKTNAPFFARIQFTIDETGRPTRLSLTKPSRYPEIDALLLETLKNMPSWKAGRNSQNKAVAETFSFFYPFSDGC